MGKQIKIIIFCLIGIFYILNFPTCLTAESGKDNSPAAFEDALKNYETYRQKEQSVIARKISFELNKKIEDWLTQAKKTKESLLGTRVEQNWEKLASFFPFPPAHYEYILRGYDYNVIKNDVVKTESITTPYKAPVSIEEKLYVEKYHTPDMSDITNYFFTVTTIYYLNFEYQQDKIELIHTDNKIVNIENDVPDKIRKKSF